MAHPKNYLRTERLRNAFSLREIALMVGLSKDTIGKYELEKREISARLLIAAPIIFGVEPAVLFPHLYAEIQDKIASGALAILTEIERQDASNTKKRALLEGIPNRSASLDV